MKKERTDTTMQSDRWSYLWLAIGTLLSFLWTIPLVWWLSPVFMLRFMRTQKVWRGFVLAWLTTFLTVGVTQYGMMNALMPSPLPVYLITMAVFALPYALPYLADRLLAPRLKGFAATLVFPLAVTAVDFVSAKANPLGSIGAQAYFQYGNLALMQLLSITGMWGITFLVNWFGSVVNWAWGCAFEWRKIRRGVAVYAGIMLVVLLYGGARLAYAPPATGTVRMHGITAVDMRQNWAALNQMKEQEGWEAMRQKAAEYHDLYFEETVREARAGAQLVHWPEQAVMVPGEDEPAFIARAQEIARQEDVYLALAFGAVFQGGRPWENKLIIIDPAGDIVLEHHKYALAALEGTKGGDGVLRTVETPFGTLSGIICNDANHEEMVLQAGRNGTDILLAPSMEYREIDPIHAHMAIYRAVENGVTVVRQADNGLSFVADSYGRVVSAMDHWTASERVSLAQVPIQSAFTIYPYIGDLFAWLSIAGFVAITIWVVVRERRANKPAAGR
ncbi:MAG: nitrilase-related carbon-nitrogen hydrolase [Chloroflexota bacterium]|nr:nitrilase-related carbon-nitrogen hydrolase [Chloroflexota bacterium]